MGSLSRELPSTSRPSPSTNFRIYASFCSRHPSPNTNISNWVECYNPSNNSWHHVSAIPGLIENHVLKGFSMVTIGDSIYIIGGRLCHKMVGDHQDPDHILEIDLEVLSSVLRYDVRNGTWSKCAPLSTLRFNFACIVHEHKIYVAGGQYTSATARGISSAEMYDPVLNVWKALPDMSTLRYKCVGVTWQGKVHVVGGFAGKGNSWDTIERSSAEVYDSERAKWDLIVGMWQLDVPPNQIVATNGKLFSSGDCLNAWKGHIEASDEKLNIWKEVDGSYLQTLSSPISTSDATDASWSLIHRIYLTMAPIGTHLYFLAGYRMPGEISRMKSVVHVFDTSANEDRWRSFEPIEEDGEKELCSHCFVVDHVL